MEAATNPARTQKASVLALPTHATFGATVLIISVLLLTVWKGEPSPPPSAIRDLLVLVAGRE